MNKIVAQLIIAIAFLSTAAVADEVKKAGLCF